jgi:hypothetical protein
MCTTKSFASRVASKAALFTFVLGAAGIYNEDSTAEQGLPATAPAQSHAVALRLADLERAFWICDYTATTHGVHATPADLCEAAYVEFKERKFGGDFQLLLAWWHANKAAEHRKIDEAGF